MEEEAKLLSNEIQLLQQDYERFALNTELKIERFKIEGSDLLRQLQDEVAKTDILIYELVDKLKAGKDTVDQITSVDDKLLANDVLVILKDVCMTFKDFAIDHNKLIKARTQTITSKNIDYMEFIETAFDFHSRITEKFQARMDFVNKIEVEKEKLRGSNPSQTDQKVE